jgi:hypothetical protein
VWRTYSNPDPHGKNAIDNLISIENTCEFFGLDLGSSKFKIKHSSWLIASNDYFHFYCPREDPG